MRGAKVFSIACILFVTCNVEARESYIGEGFVKGQLPESFFKELKYNKGDYYVNVRVNNQDKGTRKFQISENDEHLQKLCVDKSLFESLNVSLTNEGFRELFPKGEKCVDYENSFANITFDINDLALDITIPQAYQKDMREESLWDYGINYFRMDYNLSSFANFSDGEDTSGLFGLVGVSSGYEEWKYRADINIDIDEKRESNTEIQSFSASKPFKESGSELSFGKLSTHSQLIERFAFKGGALYTDKSMSKPGSLDYVPKIVGVAKVASKITVKQNGYTLYTSTVQAGPYSIDDISPSSNGDIEVFIEGLDGSGTTKEIYPVASLPAMLKSGVNEFSIDAGVSDIEGINNASFFTARFNQGFDFGTFITEGLISNDYQVLSTKIMWPLGGLGAIGTEASYSYATLKDSSRSGGSFGLEYSKQFEFGLGVQFLAYKFEDKDFYDFKDFLTENTNPSAGIKRKSRYESSITGSVLGLGVTASYWREDYWVGEEKDGLNLYSTKNLDNGIGIGLLASFSNDRNIRRDDYSVSISVYLPLGSEDKFVSDSSLSLDKYNEISLTENISGSLSENVFVSGGGKVTGGSFESAQANLNYNDQKLRASVGLENRKDSTVVRAGISSSILYTNKTGLINTGVSNSNIVIADLKGIGSARLTTGEETNDEGIAIRYTSPYRDNYLAFDLGNLDESIKLDNNYIKFIPVKDSIIYKSFGYKHINNYYLRIRNKQGDIIRGAEVVNGKGDYLGYVDFNGVYVGNSEHEIDSIRLVFDNDKYCEVKGIQQNVRKIQNVVCD